MKFKLVESLNQLPKEIIDLNKKMNKAEYNAKDFEHYRTIPVDEWDLNNAGCCWDFVSYEAYQFDKMKYDYETYFVQIDNNNDCPTLVSIFLNIVINGIGLRVHGRSIKA